MSTTLGSANRLRELTADFAAPPQLAVTAASSLQETCQRASTRQWDATNQINDFLATYGSAVTVEEIYGQFELLWALINHDPLRADKTNAQVSQLCEAEAHLGNALIRAVSCGTRDIHLKMRVVMLSDALPDEIEYCLLENITQELAAASQSEVAISHDADAALIDLCAQHIRNMDAFDASDSDLEFDENPLWRAYEETRDALVAAQPMTVLGLLALARTAKAEARCKKTGEETFEGCFASNMAAKLVNETLRLAPALGGPALTPEDREASAVPPALNALLNLSGGKPRKTASGIMDATMFCQLDLLNTLVGVQASSPRGAMLQLVAVQRRINDLLDNQAEDHVATAEEMRQLMCSAFAVLQQVPALNLSQNISNTRLPRWLDANLDAEERLKAKEEDRS